MRQKFHMDRYYDDLGNVEEKLSRIKSEKSAKQLRREDSRNNLGSGEISTWAVNRSPVVPARPFVIDNRPSRVPSKENDSLGRFSKPRIRLDSRYDRDPSFIDTNQTIMRKPADLTTIDSSKFEDNCH